MEFEFSQHIFEKSSNIKLIKNPFRGSRVVPCGRAHRQTDTRKLGVTFRNFAKAPKNWAGIWLVFIIVHDILCVWENKFCGCVKNTDCKVTVHCHSSRYNRTIHVLATDGYVCLNRERETSLKSNLSPHSLGARETRTTERD